jgi:hypothetical protein
LGEWVEFDAKIIDAVAAAAGGRGIFRGGCAGCSCRRPTIARKAIVPGKLQAQWYSWVLNFAEFAKRLMRVAGFAFLCGRILHHDWTGIFVDISFEAH